MKQPALGKRLTDLRKEKGLTQEELVELCNISVRTIQRIEAGDVIPRAYTVKTILAALGYDFKKIKDFDMAFGLEMSDKEPKVLQKISGKLTLAIVFGILFFFIGFAEFYVDWNRWFEDTMAVSNSTYIVLKFLVFSTYAFFMWGFVEIGILLKNQLLKTSALSFIGFFALYNGYLVFSLFNPIIPMELFMMSASVLTGVVGLGFGVGILQLKKPLEMLATITGIFELVVAFMFVTVFLAWIGWILYTPLILLEIALIFKIKEWIRKIQ